MATARRLLADPRTSGVFHCISRCARRAYLCGRDEYSGRDFEHRRKWIRDRLQVLASLFGVDVYAYAVMSNHFHVVVRTDPGRIAVWADAEVARRWLTLFPGPGGKRGQPPEGKVITSLCADTAKLKLCRERLGDVSWFMRCLNEPIARRANREDECSGRFWEGRFKCQRLDGEGAILACMAYVDLNPVRAGMATTPETSDFTSAQDRSVACQARRQLAAAPVVSTAAQEPLLTQARREALRDAWLVPIIPLDTPNPGIRRKGSDEPVVPGVPPVILDMSVDNYLELLDWTGRQIRSGKRGHISEQVRPVLERFSGGVIPQMLVVGRLLDEALPSYS